MVSLAVQRALSQSGLPSATVVGAPLATFVLDHPSHTWPACRAHAGVGLELPPDALVMSAGPIGLVRSLRRQRKASAETHSASGDRSTHTSKPLAAPDDARNSLAATSAPAAPSPQQRGGKLRVARACSEAREISSRVESLMNANGP